MLGGLSVRCKRFKSSSRLLRTHLAVVRGRACFKAVAPEQAALKAQVRPLRNWRAAVSAELDAPFAGEAPLGRFLWFRGRGKAVVAMVFHHTIADGKSGANLLIEVLRRAGGEDIPLNVRQPHPSAQDLDLIQSQGCCGKLPAKAQILVQSGPGRLEVPQATTRL
jgi:hypothetical protein